MMTAISLFDKQIYLAQAKENVPSRPNIINHLIIRMGLGLLLGVLPLLMFLFVVNFGVNLRANTLSLDWQVFWAGHLAWAFVGAMFSSLRIAVIIRIASAKRAWLLKYGRTVGRICTIGATGLSVIIPYTVLNFGLGIYTIPAFILACFLPIITFIVVRSGTKDYLLRLRIWYDLNN